MKYIKVCLALIITLSVIQASCSSKSKAEFNGGSCTYASIEGYAKIKSITPAPVSDYNCPDKPMQIIFEFTPVNKSDRQKYRFMNINDSSVNMRINDGANPSMAWIKKNGIETGKKFRCLRTEIVSGTCTPVIFKFPGLNLFPVTGCN